MNHLQRLAVLRSRLKISSHISSSHRLVTPGVHADPILLISSVNARLVIFFPPRAVGGQWSSGEKKGFCNSLMYAACIALKTYRDHSDLAHLHLARLVRTTYRLHLCIPQANSVGAFRGNQSAVYPPAAHVDHYNELDACVGLETVGSQALVYRVQQAEVSAQADARSSILTSTKGEYIEGAR